MKLYLLPFLVLPWLGAAQTETQIEYLASFAKLYGYIKYFHPSDEAAEADWDQLCIQGVEKILVCKNQMALRDSLTAIFSPLAPSIQIVLDSTSTYDLQQITPRDTADYVTTYWQHQGLGFGMSQGRSPYRSVRINRKEVKPAQGFGNIMQSIPAHDLAGRKIKVSATVKLAKHKEGTGHLWLRVDLKNQGRGFFDNMSDRPIVTDQWKEYSIEGVVDSQAIELAFGCFLIGDGQLFVDNYRVEFWDRGDWQLLPISNGDFEDSDQIKSWSTPQEPYRATITREDPYQGERSALIYLDDDAKMLAKSIFSLKPEKGEVLTRSIGSGLYVQFPLVLYCNEEHTFPMATSPSRITYEDKPEPSLSLASRLSAIIITWNVFQHFYPYFDVIACDWEEALTEALADCFNEPEEEDFKETIQRLTATLEDGHIWVTKHGEEIHFVPPIHWEWIEDQLVLTGVYDDQMNLRRGDVVSHINTIPARDYFSDLKSRISAATEGYLLERAQKAALMGPKGSTLEITVNGVSHLLPRTLEYHPDLTQLISRGQRPAHRRIDHNTYYLNLDKISMSSIDSLLPDLRVAKAIICDLRGYPNGNHGLINHLLNTPDTSSQWMQIPQFVYPDQLEPKGYQMSGWNLQPEEPHIGGKVVFITDGSAISYAESFMSFIEGYDLALIVGQPTAGTNGNVNRFTLPGGYMITWTGMRVLKHDGSRLHGVGILPDVRVEKTLQGVKSGEDEFLEKALEMVRKE